MPKVPFTGSQTEVGSSENTFDAEPPALLSAIKYARIKEMENYQEVYLQLIKATEKRNEELLKGTM